MNNYYGRHAIVTIESTGSFITLKTYDAQHGNSMRMYIDSNKLYRWIDSEAQSVFLNHDCGSFTILRRISKETISVRLTWLHTIGCGNVKGYTQDFDFHDDDLMAVLLTGDRVRKLAALEGKSRQAQITITNGAHRQIRALNKQQRRALSKAMQNAKAKGKKVGRKPTTKDDIPAVFYKHYPTFAAKKMNVSELARVCGLSRPTVYKYLRLIE